MQAPPHSDNGSKCRIEEWGGQVQGEAFGVRRLVAAFRRRLVAVEVGEATDSGTSGCFRGFLAPLRGPLLGRPVGQADKAATSRRTPKL